MFSENPFKCRGVFGLVCAKSGLFPSPLKFGGLKCFDGAMEVLHGGVGELQRVEGKAVHKGGECEGGSEPGFLGVTLGRAAGAWDEGEDGCEFPQAAGVPAVLESVVVSFGCAGAGPAASSRHGRPPMGCEGYADLWVGDGKAMEGPRLLTRKTTTPVSTRLVRLSGCFASAAILGDPHACLRRLTEVEGVSVWGLSVRQQRSTELGNGVTTRCRGVPKGILRC